VNANHRNLSLSFFLLILLAWPGGLIASEAVPKQVHLIVQGNRLIASNVLFSRFDELKLNARERIIEQVEAEAVIVVVTNQRIIGYGLQSGWREMRTEAGEKLESLRVQDFSALIITDSRYLNFNGSTGLWGQQDQRVER
jgi:hypothetical protein